MKKDAALKLSNSIKELCEEVNESIYNGRHLKRYAVSSDI